MLIIDGFREPRRSEAQRRGFVRELRREEKQELSYLTTCRSAQLSCLLLAEVADRIASTASDGVLDNLEGGLKHLLGRQEQVLWESHPARQWLDAALRDLASEFADEFTEDVVEAAHEVCRDALRDEQR